MNLTSSVGFSEKGRPKLIAPSPVSRSSSRRTNGTYVKLGTTEAFVRRDELLITGEGAISLGRPFSENPTELVKFTTEL